MEILVTSTTEDQRFATAGGHDLDPTWFLSALVSVEVFECTNMVHLNGLGQAGRPAMLTDLSQEPPFEFRSVVPLLSLRLVFDGGFDLPLQGDGSPSCYQ